MSEFPNICEWLLVPPLLWHGSSSPLLPLLLCSFALLACCHLLLFYTCSLYLVCSASLPCLLSSAALLLAALCMASCATLLSMVPMTPSKAPPHGGIALEWYPIITLCCRCDELKAGINIPASRLPARPPKKSPLWIYNFGNRFQLEIPRTELSH